MEARGASELPTSEDADAFKFLHGSESWSSWTEPELPAAVAAGGAGESSAPGEAAERAGSGDVWGSSSSSSSSSPTSESNSGTPDELGRTSTSEDFGDPGAAAAAQLRRAPDSPPPSTGVDAVGSILDRASRSQELRPEDVATLAAHRATLPLSPRPDILGGRLECARLFVEGRQDSANRRRNKHVVQKADKWLNSGGKRGLIISELKPTTSAGTSSPALVVSRRSGRVLRAGAEPGDILCRFYSYALGRGPNPTSQTAEFIVFQIFRTRPRQASNAAAAVQRTARPPNPSRAPDAQDGEGVPVLDFGLVARVRQMLSGGDGAGRSQAHATLSTAAAGELADSGPAKRRRRGGGGGGGAHAQMAYSGLMLMSTMIACLHRNQHQGTALPGRALQASGAAEGGGFFAALTGVDTIASRWHQPEEPELFLVRPLHAFSI